MPFGSRLSLLAFASLALLASGCHLVLPEVTHQPVVHNPFPQLSRVAVVPFFNQSGEPTVDGRLFAEAYFAELQGTPGFEVVPVAAVEAAIIQNGVTFDPPSSAPDQIRLLAQRLGVDAVIVGTVTDFSPYYPPRCGVRVEWYAANAGFHEIPAGYGLPWGTPEEEYIPDSLVFEAEMALAREQLATQSPLVDETAVLTPMREQPALEGTPDTDESWRQREVESLPPPPEPGALQATDFAAPIDETDPLTAPAVTGGGIVATDMLPPDWPDARGFTPPGPSPTRPRAQRNPGPVMTHTRVYRGTDPDFTSALAAYVGFRDDARFGGWQSYLSRSEDFVRFCCHLHLVETLSARGGGGETRVVRRWSGGR